MPPVTGCSLPDIAALRLQGSQRLWEVGTWREGLAFADKDLNLSPSLATNWLGGLGPVSELAWVSFPSYVKWA